MRDPFHKSKSAEQFAAWLDGNLPLEDMMSFSEDVSEDHDLQQIADLCDMADDDVAAFEESGAKLPLELNNDYFELPDLDRPYAHERPILADMCYACCAAPPEENEEEGLIDRIHKFFSNKDESEEDEE